MTPRQRRALAVLVFLLVFGLSQEMPVFVYPVHWLLVVGIVGGLALWNWPYRR